MSSNQSVLVQVVKEPISTKDQEAELLCRKIYCLVPFSDRVSISQKIEDKKEKEQKTISTIHQTKRIWCYCSHSSRRQKYSRIKRFAEPAQQMDCNVKNYQLLIIRIRENSTELFHIKRRFNDTFRVFR
jgi:hypothetical protein